MLARHISMEGGTFIVIFLILVLCFENSVIHLLRKILGNKKCLIGVIEIVFFLIIARVITVILCGLLP